MRDLKRAAKDGPRAFLASLADLPHRHPFAISAAITGLLVVLLGLGAYSGYQANRSVSGLRPQVTQVIRAASVCNARALTREKDSARCAARLRIALLNCRRHPSCLSEFEKVRDGKAAPPVENDRRTSEDFGSGFGGGDIGPDISPDTDGPPSAGNGQPDGKPEGQDDGQSEGQGPGQAGPGLPPQGPQDAAVAPPTPSPTTPAPTATNAPEPALEVCARIVVPACAKLPEVLPQR